MPDNYLYIFMHVPKCAGVTFRYHSEKNLNERERFLVSFDKLGLDMYDPPSDPAVFKKASENLFGKLTKRQKERIRLIYGHPVAYGIHKYFDRPSRYFTFIRNPINRTVSVYKHLIRLHKKAERKVRQKRYLKKTLLIDGEIPGFARWLEEKYQGNVLKRHLKMTGYLSSLGYIKRAIDKNKIDNKIKESLQKFYFVGITKKYSECSLYFYKKLGFKKFFLDQNISRMRLKVDLKNKKLIEKIKKRNKADELLYKGAIESNEEFRNDTDDFFNIIKRKKVERAVKLPFTQSIFAPRRTVIRLSKALFGKDKLFSTVSEIR